MKKTLRTALFLCLAAGMLLLAACGNDGKTEETEPVSPSEITVTRSASPKFFA